MADTNIVENYKWTITRNKQYLKLAPYIRAISYDVGENNIIDAGQAFLMSLGAGGGVDYYKNLHNAAKEKDTWKFPFFTDEVRGFTNDWAGTYVGSTNGSQSAGTEIIGDMATLVGSVVTSLAQANSLLKGAAGTLFEPPKFYQYGANDSTVSLEFTLINTDEEDDYKKNYEIVKKLILDNRMSRESGLIAKPPVLWELIVPGYRYISWAACSVNIGLLGRREMREGKLIPEGYKINLTFTSLYSEPREFESKYTEQDNLAPLAVNLTGAQFDNIA